MDQFDVIGVLDLETNILNKEIGSNKASPFYPDNSIVLGGMCVERYAPEHLNNMPNKLCYYIHKGRGHAINAKTVKCFFDQVKVVVGHNLKFDLLYIKKFYNKIYLDWVKQGGMVWDTQIAAYLLSGQDKIYPSLDYCAELHGGTLKDDKIKQYWQAGVDTADIPTHELSEYLNYDLQNTSLVFHGQFEIVDRLEMFPVVMNQMEALLALVEMEYNGMAFDKEKAITEALHIRVRVESLKENILATIDTLLPDNKRLPTKISSMQLSTILFGGSVDVIQEAPMLDGAGNEVRYKSGIKKGKIRTKKKIVAVKHEGLGFKSPNGIGKNGYYPTDEKTLAGLKTQATPLFRTRRLMSGTPFLSVENFLDSLLMYRELNKDLTTYYDGLVGLIYPDGLLHPNFNQTATVTGRLSSNAPNAQNFSSMKK